MIVLRDVIILYHDESSINADNHDKYDSLFIKIRLFSRTSKLSSYTNEPQNTAVVPAPIENFFISTVLHLLAL